MTIFFHAQDHQTTVSTRQECKLTAHFESHISTVH